jgi:hypothetical protein
LPGPNFDVPRDLFMEERWVKKRAKWFIRYVIKSHGNRVFGTDTSAVGQRVGPCSSPIFEAAHYTIMSTARRRLVNRIEDVTLGAFGNLQPSDTLNHLIRYLSTWNGSECVYFSFFASRVNSTEMFAMQQTIHGNDLLSF